MGKDPQLSPVGSDEDWEAKGWAEDPEPLTAAPRLGTMISVRLDPEGARSVRRAARAEGMTQSEFVRRAALRSAAEVIAREPTVIAAPAGEAPLIVWTGAKITVTRTPRSTTSTAISVAPERLGGIRVPV